MLTRGEQIALLAFAALALGSFTFLAINFYIGHTQAVPAFGGTYVEGVVGQPRFINPIYGETNDTDRTLIDLVFSGLMNYDSQGNLVKDLAQDYKISADGKTYTFTLKPNARWHDGKALTADDIIFTVKTIQNSDYKSPLRANWIDVGTQKISDTSLSFTLKQPYNSFLENCTLKILPKHIWEAVSPENFILSAYNLQPIGSGPFTFASLSQSKTGFIETLSLQSNRRYYQKPSFLAGITFDFFPTNDDLISAAKAKKINGLAPAASDQNAGAKKDLGQTWSGASTFLRYSFTLPRYFAVFFNTQKPSLFSDASVRKAMAASVNKDDLIKTIEAKAGAKLSLVDSPILPDFYHYQPPAAAPAFDLQKSATLLDAAGFKQTPSGQRQKATTKKPAFQFKSYLRVGSRGTEVTQLQTCLSKLSDQFKGLLANQTPGKYDKETETALTQFQQQYLQSAKSTGETGAATRQKLNELCNAPINNTQALAFTLVTINQPQLVAVANLLKTYWQAAGAQVTINAVSITDLKPIIKNRNYDALLYGQALGMEPDLYPFWYSSQKQDPGLNLSLYENKDVDKLLQQARQTQDPAQKEQDLEKLQTMIINDAPALFLYNPDYDYWVSPSVKGIGTQKIADPAKRFVNVTSWFMQTKRVWK